MSVAQPEGESDPDRVILGRIGRVYGIQGWVRLQSFTDPIENLAEYQHFEVLGRSPTPSLEMDGIQFHGSGLIAHFVGYDTPEVARNLTGLELAVLRKDLPPLAPGEYYWHQLQDLRVVNVAGEDLGRISHLLETGANDVLVVRGDAGSIDERERLIPYLKERVVKAIDLEQGVITVDWAADFLQ